MPSIPSVGSTTYVAPSLDTPSTVASTPVTHGDSFGVGGTPNLTSPVTGGGAGAIGAMSWTPAAYSLAPTVGLGAVTIHRFQDHRVLPSTIAITVFAPLGTSAQPGVVLDLNAKKHHEILPERCVIGDANVKRAFLGIDKRPGTPLRQKIDAIVAKIPKNADGSIDPETAIQYVRIQTGNLLAWAPGSSANDGAPHLSWDKAVSVPGTVWDTFWSVANQNVGDLPVSTGEQIPVVPLEKYLEIGQGYCIQKAVLASLILEAANVPHRLVNGAVSTGPGTSVGHTWLQLPDGRVLDPAWKIIEQPQTQGPPVEGFFKVGSSWRFENQTFPYLSV